MRRCTLVLFATAICLLSNAGCASVMLGPPRVTNRTVMERTPTAEQRFTSTGEIQQAEDTVRVFAVAACSLHARTTETVQVTYKQERRLVGDARGYILLGSVVAAALGTYLYLDAESISEADREQAIEEGETEYSSPGAVRGAGGAFIGLGALGVAVVLVDTLRGMGSRTTTEVIRRPGPLGPASDTCGERLVVGARVTATVDEAVYQLGTTDDTGMLDVPVDQLVRQFGASSAVINVEGQAVGEWPM